MAKENTKKKVGSAQKLGNKIKSIDAFGEGVGFNIGEGKQTHQTYFGSVLTLITIVITFTYAFKRYIVMSEYGDTSYQSTSLISSDITRDSPLTQEDKNFNLMFNLVHLTQNGI